MMFVHEVDVFSGIAGCAGMKKEELCIGLPVFQYPV